MCINPGYTETGIVAPNMDMSTFLLKKEWLPQLQKELQSRPPPQSAENVGNAVIHMIREGKPGSLWVSEFNNPVYEIVFPPYITMKVQ
ncbi:hypothetical protein C0J52_05939 [Blattella germanica]|nr:hypothetical protein C0J52_05939 [Blattella germanica]